MKQTSSEYPILSCREAARLEASLLGDETAEWAAMQLAGAGIARAFLRDYQELAPLPEAFNLLALIGKGNNGGDALIACSQLLKDFPDSRITLLFTEDEDHLKPLAKRACGPLRGRANHYRILSDMDEATIRNILDQEAGDRGFDVCIDGLLGMSFKPPVRKSMARLINVVNSFDRIHLRAAVDLPSGKGDASDELFFRADFSYATGIPKKVLFEESQDCGRIRVIDLGFHKNPECAAFKTRDTVLAADAVLQPLQTLRPTDANKYTFGHLFIIGGSATMPGALLMAVQAALRSGVGLVTAFAPSSVAPALAAQVPEAMWVPWPEKSSGSLDEAAIDLFLERANRATAVLIGPGMGKDTGVAKLARDIIGQVELPIVLDADALRIEVIQSVSDKRKAGSAPVILTPHTGEFARMARLETADVPNETLRAFCREYGVTTVLKGPLTRICDGDYVRYSIHGGPVLSRGGSGDLLAGLSSGMLAQKQFDMFSAVSCAITLHGLAAERLAQRKGQVCVHTTQLLDYLSEVLRLGG